MTRSGAGSSFGDLVSDAAEQAVRKNLAPVIDALQRGDFSALRIPFRQTPDMVKQDAQERAWRTFVQQLGIDIIIALATVVGPLLLNLDVTSTEQWTIIGLTVVKTVISAIISYAFRLFFAPKEALQITLADAKDAHTGAS